MAQIDRIKLSCPLPDFEAIHRDVDKARANTKRVSVDKEALTALLMDHGRLLGLYRNRVEE